MLRTLVPFTLVLCLSFTLFIGLIQAEPYDGTELLAILNTAEDCEAPCWQQIRPGVSTPEEAIAHLEINEWVDHVTANEAMDTILWYWSGRQPDLYDHDVPGKITIRSHRVFAIDLPVKINLGDLYFLFGSPQWSSTGRTQDQVELSLSYPQEYLQLSVNIHCPTTRTTLWLAKPVVRLQTFAQPGIDLTTLLPSYAIAC